MKTSTFYSNTEKLLNKALEKNPSDVIYENTDDGVYFTPNKKKAHYVYFLPNQHICKASGMNDTISSGLMSSLFKTAAYLSEKVSEVEINGKELIRIENDNKVVKFFDKKLIKKFPDNASYYLDNEKHSPVIIGIWDKKDVRLHMCGCVFPVNIAQDNSDSE